MYKSHFFLFRRRSLEFFDLLPEDPKLYDKMRPPKKDGQATVVYFHVTVMGLDSIDENSMVILLYRNKIDMYNYFNARSNFFNCDYRDRKTDNFYRRTPPTFSLPKHGKTIDSDFRKI